jgi:thymidylate synthase
MKTINADNFTDLYEQAFEAVMNEGKVVSSRNGSTLEIQPCVLQLTNPRQRVSSMAGRKFNIAFSVYELLWVLSGRGDYEGITWYNKQMGRYFDDQRFPSHGAYGIRLRKWGSQRGKKQTDQIYEMYKKLLANKDDRRAVMVLFDPELDNDNKADIPCNNWCHGLVRDNRLSWSQVVRSNDLLWGVPYNVFIFTTMQELMASWIGVDVGTYTHFSDSLHLYYDKSEHQKTEVEIEIDSIMKHISERHPWDVDYFHLYDHYTCSKISETYEQTHDAIRLLMGEEAGMRKLQSAEQAKTTGKRLSITFDSQPFWSNCAKVLLSYNTFRRGMIDFALQEAVRIDNEFQFPLLEFYIRKDMQLLFKLEDVINKQVFTELERRYISYPSVEKSQRC